MNSFGVSAVCHSKIKKGSVLVTIWQDSLFGFLGFVISCAFPLPLKILQPVGCGWFALRNKYNRILMFTCMSPIIVKMAHHGANAPRCSLATSTSVWCLACVQVIKGFAATPTNPMCSYAVNSMVSSLPYLPSLTPKSCAIVLLLFSIVPCWKVCLGPWWNCLVSNGARNCNGIHVRNCVHWLLGVRAIIFESVMPVRLAGAHIRHRSVPGHWKSGSAP